MSSGLFQDFMDGYVRLSVLAVEHSVVVRVPNQVHPKLNPMGRQFSVPVL